MAARLRACTRNGAVLVAVVFFSALLSAASASAQTQTAVEYYYADWNYYFVTSFPDEILFLDGGGFGGAWQRTGQTFNVWTGPMNAALPTCRFFSTGFDPKSSHFYTHRADECAALRQQNSGWAFESVAFYLQLPDPGLNYDCPAGMKILYRLYNNGMGGAPNHRFITDAAKAAQMVAAGWSFEGDGPKAAYACVPQARTPGTTAEGVWLGAGGTVSGGAILDDGTFYFLYMAPGSDNTVGVVQGNGVSVNGEFSSANAKDFNFAGLGVRNAALGGSYLPRTTLNGTISTAYGTSNFATSYDPSYEQPANPAAVAGRYPGQAASAASFSGQLSAVVTLNADSTLSGTWGTCSFTGTATPRDDVNVFDLTLTFLDGSCAFGAGSLSGFAYYTAADQGLFLIAINASRSDGFLFVSLRP